MRVRRVDLEGGLHGARRARWRWGGAIDLDLARSTVDKIKKYSTVLYPVPVPAWYGYI